MGDYLLMKTMLLLLTLPLIALAQNTQPDLKWVDEEIAANKPGSDVAARRSVWMPPIM